MCSSRCRSRPFRRHGWGSRPSTSISPRARLPVRRGTQLRSPRSHRAGARRTSAPASVPAVRSSHDAAPPRPSAAQAGSAGEAADRAQTALDDPTNAEHLRRTRPRIERLLGLLAHRYGARKSRYIGTRKARLQAAWAAALVNLNPLARHLTATTA